MKVDAVPSVDVSIRCDGALLPEFEDESDQREGDLVSVRYVEASSGSNFTVYFATDHFDYGKWPQVVCEIKLDGRMVWNPILDVSDFHYIKRDIEFAYGIENGRSVTRRFKFADLATNDGKVDHAKTVDFKHLGEIEIKVYSCRKLELQESHTPMVSMSDGTVPEKCLKGRAISNRAALDKAEPAKPPITWQLEWENRNRPIGTYIFKYRSRRDLQIEGMIPRSPSPAPLEERDPNDLSPEEARELIRRMRTQGSDSSVKVKKEKRARAAEDDEDDDEEITVTEERNSKRTRLSTDSGVEIIDLTDD